MLLFMLLFHGLSASPHPKSIEEETIEYILEGYDPNVRHFDPNDPVTLMNVSVSSFFLFMVDQQEETIKFSSEFILTWFDPALRWDTKMHNISWVKVKEDEVWKPDTAVSTSISKTELLEKAEQYVDVRADGLIRQSFYAVFDNECDLKIDLFPFDSQSCDIEIGPWTYFSNEVYTVALQKLIEPSDEFQGNSEWDFLTMTSRPDFSQDTDYPFNYTTVIFTVNIKRRPEFYVWVLLVPTFIITTISIVGIFIPTNSVGEREERVTLGLTTLLSTAVILQIVASTMPKASSLPLLGNFILAEIFVTAVGVFCSVIVLVLHYITFTRRCVPSELFWYIANFPIKRHRHYTAKIFASADFKKPQLKEKEAKGNSILGDLEKMLNQVTYWVYKKERREEIELAWTRFFDRLDMVFLILFQITNILILLLMT